MHRSFKGHASLDFKLVVPDGFIAMFRQAAQAEDASEFHKLTQARHPENDDAFAEAIISNALRRVIRNSLLDELAAVNLGATVSPVKMELHASVPGHDAPSNPQVVQVKPDTEVHASDDVGGALAYIASNHTPVESGICHGGID